MIEGEFPASSATTPISEVCARRELQKEWHRTSISPYQPQQFRRAILQRENWSMN